MIGFSKDRITMKKVMAEKMNQTVRENSISVKRGDRMAGEIHIQKMEARLYNRGLVSLHIQRINRANRSVTKKNRTKWNFR